MIKKIIVLLTILTISVTVYFYFEKKNEIKESQISELDNNYSSNLLENIKKPEEPENMTLVCEGGAFLGAYQNGALQVVREMERQNYVPINYSSW